MRNAPSPDARTVIAVLAVWLGLGLCSCANAGETDRIAELLALEPGNVLADVGAGDGDWAFRLAERVGDTKRRDRYREAISSAARFVLQLEVRDAD